MNDESVVYLVQQPPPIYRAGKPPVMKDLSSAQRYGVITPILTEGEQASATPGPCLHKMGRALKEFNPARDYLCFAGGDPMALALAFLALASSNLRTATILRWERERRPDGSRASGGFYVPVEVPLRPGG